MITRLFASALISYLFGATETTLWPGGPSITVHLYRGDPNAGGTEPPQSTGYRSQVTLPPDWDAFTGTVVNNKTITFPEATAEWGTITHVQLCSPIHGIRTPLFYGVLDRELIIYPTQVLQFFKRALEVDYKDFTILDYAL